MKKHLSLTIGLIFSALASFTWAETYTIMIGAHKVEQSNNPKIFATRIGSFASVKEAQSLLTALHASGYKNAYVASVMNAGDMKEKENGDLIAKQATVMEAESDFTDLNPEQRQALASLSPEEFAKAFYMNDQLMIEDGSQVMSLEQYRSSN